MTHEFRYCRCKTPATPPDSDPVCRACGLDIQPGQPPYEECPKPPGWRAGPKSLQEYIEGQLEPITLRTTSLEDHTRQAMIKGGWEHDPDEDSYTITRGSLRIKMTRTADGWLNTTDILTGVRVLDVEDTDEMRELFPDFFPDQEPE